MSNKYIKMQKGIILPVVLIFFAFLMLLAVTFVSISGFQAQQSSTKTDRTQAYYYAKSGAETTADYIIKNTDSLQSENERNQFITSITSQNNFLKYDFNETKVEVIISRENHLININSKAYYKSVTTSVEVTLVITEGKTNLLPTEQDSTEVKNKVIVLVDDDDVRYNQLLDANKLNVNQSKRGDPTEYPIFWHSLKDKSLYPKILGTQINSFNHPVVYIPNLTASNNLEIDLSIGNRTIIVDNFYVKKSSKVILKPENTNNKLVMYITNSFIAEGDSHIFSENSFANAKVYSDGNITFENGTNFFGSIFMSKPDTKITFANFVTIKGLIYAPKSIIDFQNHATINGSLVIRNILYKPNTTLSPAYYKDLNFFFEEDDTGEDSGNDQGEIIETDKTRIKYDLNPWN